MATGGSCSRYMRTPWLCLVVGSLILCSVGCGARSGLRFDGVADSGSAQEDHRVALDGGAPPPSCWTEPNCIEADLRFDDRIQLYRQVPMVNPSERELWVHGPESESVRFLVKLFRHASVGNHPWDLLHGDVFVSFSMGSMGEDTRCQMLDDIVLLEVDTDSEGVTTGEFGGGGPRPGCSGLSVGATGRFRVTSP